MNMILIEDEMESNGLKTIVLSLIMVINVEFRLSEVIEKHMYLWS